MRMIQFRREKWCEWEISKRKVLWASRRVHGYSSEEFGRWLEWIRWIGEGNGSPLQYSCLENPMDEEAWKAAVHGITESWTQLSDFTFTFHLHALEKEMATLSSVLAWRIPGTGEPGGLPSMWSHRVRQWLSSSSSSILNIIYVLLLLFFPRPQSEEWKSN